MERDNKELASGWTRDQVLKTFHFSHIDRDTADSLLRDREEIHVVETVCEVLADDGSVHRNLYFGYGLYDALAQATAIEIYAQLTAECVVAVRPATAEEIDRFWRATDRLAEPEPIALSDEEIATKSLPEKHGD